VGTGVGLTVGVGVGVGLLLELSLLPPTIRRGEITQPVIITVSSTSPIIVNPVLAFITALSPQCLKFVPAACRQPRFLPC
jgi:hypothetical protein